METIVKAFELQVGDTVQHKGIKKTITKIEQRHDASFILHFHDGSSQLANNQSNWKIHRFEHLANDPGKREACKDAHQAIKIPESIELTAQDLLDASQHFNFWEKVKIYKNNNELFVTNGEKIIKFISSVPEKKESKTAHINRWEKIS